MVSKEMLLIDATLMSYLTGMPIDLSKFFIPACEAIGEVNLLSASSHLTGKTVILVSGNREDILKALKSIEPLFHFMYCESVSRTFNAPFDLTCFACDTASGNVANVPLHILNEDDVRSVFIEIESDVKVLKYFSFLDNGALDFNVQEREAVNYVLELLS